MAPKRKSKSRSVPYDPELPVNWTIKRLKEELAKKGIHAPPSSRRMALVRLLNDSEHGTPDIFETTPRQSPVNTNNGGSSGDRTVIDIVSRLTSTVQTLQQTVNNLNTKVNSLTTQVNQASQRSTETASVSNRSEGPVRGNAVDRGNVQNTDKDQEFTMATAIAAFNSPLRVVPAAAGSEEQLQQTLQGGYQRTRTTYGYAAESLPLVETVAPHIRQNILAGKDINLAALLIPYYMGPSSEIHDEFNQNSCHNNKTDNRLNRCLNIGEFIQAFGIYKSIMCGTFPSRRTELDLYERDIVDMASKYPGKGFYEYHKQFSLIAASQLKYNNILVDWSVRNNTLFCNIFANIQPHSCDHCDSTLHSTGFCPSIRNMEDHKGNSMMAFKRKSQPGDKESDSHGRKRINYKGREICNNYNGDRGCNNPRCINWHICLECKGEHPKVSCATSKNDSAPQYKGAMQSKR